MIRTIAFSLAFVFGMSASPLSQNAQKEIHPAMTNIVYAAAEPCPDEPIILVTLARDDEVAAKPIIKAKVKVKKKLKKKKPVLTAKQKKKLAAAIAAQKKLKDKKTDHHKSKVPDHHKSIPSSHSTSHGPLHLTSPPGCG